MNTSKKLWIALAVLVLLSPLGLILPARFGAGSAWGEWSAEEMKSLVGYVPRGMSKLSGLSQAPMPDYALKGQEKSGLAVLSGSYLLSGIVGVAVVCLIAFLAGKLLRRRGGPDAS
jgi:hypothetical protein